METRSRAVDGLGKPDLPTIPTGDFSADFSMPMSSGRQKDVVRNGIEKVERFGLCLFSMSEGMEAEKN